MPFEEGGRGVRAKAPYRRFDPTEERGSKGVSRPAEQSLPDWARLSFDTPPFDKLRTGSSAATQDEEDGGRSLPRAESREPVLSLSRGRYSG